MLKLVKVNRNTKLVSEDGDVREYILQSEGEDLQELEENAVIIEKDEDGELFEGAPIGMYSKTVYRYCMGILEEAFDSTEE